MDLLDDHLGGVRTRGAVFCRSLVEPPWSLRFIGPVPLALAIALTGDAWITLDGSAPVPVRKGDIALVRGTRPFTVADDPATPVGIVIEDESTCYTVGDGPALDADGLILGPRTWGIGDAADGADTFLFAEYPLRGDVGDRLLDSLPDLAVVPAGPELAPLTALLAVETSRVEPGQQIVLDRLLDMLLVKALRAWFARPEAEPPAGYRALADPRVGRALRAVHDEPGRPWTVAALAAEAGMSRAAFARTFTELVGMAPMAYVTEWRMTLATDMLRERGASVAAVARRVGYSDGFAFSSAFKRVRGRSPSAVLAEARQP
ncbi:AraC family transcriptional regulator [Spirillospora sp. NPDC029432]|uniref:AraC family transcriptional regulator n=1 Tax=Spirillospora sp. NPDC029432 TaxID=3154599 RepID=UPI0034532101